MVDKQEILHQVAPHQIIAQVSDYLSAQRKQRIETVIHSRLQGIHLAIENPYDPRNAAATIRSAEGLGILNAHFISVNRVDVRQAGVTQGAHAWMYLHFYETIRQFQIQQDMLIAGACYDGDCLLSDLPVDQPICLLFGNEHAGLSETALERCDFRYRIPMFGMSECFNVSVSVGISLYDLCQRKRSCLANETDLTADQGERLRAYYYLNSVQSRVLTQLFPL